MSFIYKIVNDINNKIYIGKTDFSLEKRFKEHCKDAFRKDSYSRPLYLAMQKYGTEHFFIQEIEEIEPKKASEREKHWIKYYDSYRQGYNATLGGDGQTLFDHKAILERLRVNPFPCEIAQEFNCSRDLVYEIAKMNHIIVKNKGQEIMKKEKSKEVIAYDLNGNFVQEFLSTSDAIKWCVEKGKCSKVSSGARSHISEVANGKRKTAYGYIWKYK